TLERLRASGGADAPQHVPATPVAPRKGVAKPKAKAAAKKDAASDEAEGTAEPAPSEPAARPAPPGREPDAAEKASVAETNIRVDVQVLDNLMTLVGELVLA